LLLRTIFGHDYDRFQENPIRFSGGRQSDASTLFKKIFKIMLKLYKDKEITKLKLMRALN